VGVSYRNTPIAPFLAMIGYWRDLQQYRPDKFKADTAAQKIFSAYLQGIVYVKDISALSGATQALGLQAGRTDDANASTLNQWLAKTTGRFVSGFSPSVLKEFDEYMDPQRYSPTKDEFAGWWLRHLPFARRLAGGGRPDLNVLGETIKYPSPPARGFITVERPERRWQLAGKWMADGLFLPYAGSTTKVVDKTTHQKREMTDAEKYEYAKAYGTALKDLMERQLPRLEKLNRKQAQKWLEVVQPSIQKRARNAAQKAARQ
jgi:hypothetical protein